MVMQYRRMVDGRMVVCKLAEMFDRVMFACVLEGRSTEVDPFVSRVKNQTINVYWSLVGVV